MNLLDQVRQATRTKHMSIRTEKAYVHWIERYLRFHGLRHPNTMGTAEVEAFLTHLAVEGHVSASTQNQALGALLFLYGHVMQMDLGRLDAVRARRPVRVPLVLSTGEVKQLLAAIDALPTTEPYGLMARLMYGAGLRLLECCRLRVKDIDLERDQLTVRGGKGDKDRFVMLPAAARDQACHLPHTAPLVRNASARNGPGHPHRAGVARPQRRANNHDLHPRHGKSSQPRS